MCHSISNSYSRNPLKISSRLLSKTVQAFLLETFKDSTWNFTKNHSVKGFSQHSWTHASFLHNFSLEIRSGIFSESTTTSRYFVIFFFGRTFSGIIWDFKSKNSKRGSSKRLSSGFPLRFPTRVFSKRLIWECFLTSP